MYHLVCPAKYRRVVFDASVDRGLNFSHGGCMASFKIGIQDCVRGGALLAWHSPREPQPLPTVKTDDSPSMSAPGSVPYCVGAGVGVGAPRPLAKHRRGTGGNGLWGPQPDPKRATPGCLFALVRGQGPIEHQSHEVRDVTFDETAHRCAVAPFSMVSINTHTYSTSYDPLREVLSVIGDKWTAEVMFFWRRACNA